jgi:hypothetical protein
MSKQRKGNKEAKKPKAIPDKTKTQNPPQKGHDGSVSGLFGHSK